MSREDICALTYNNLMGLTIILLFILFIMNFVTNYLEKQHEGGFYACFVVYFLVISAFFFKGVHVIHRKQIEISKKIVQPIFFIFASISSTHAHFELPSSFR